MKKTLMAFAFMVSASAMAQTNYKTCMNPNKVKKQQINLHLQKAKVLNSVGNGLAITAIASAVALYHLQGENSNGKAMIFVPLAIGGASLFTFHLAGSQESKAEKLK